MYYDKGATGPLGSETRTAIPFCTPLPGAEEQGEWLRRDAWAVTRKRSKLSLKAASSSTGCCSPAVVLAWVLYIVCRGTPIPRQTTLELSPRENTDYIQRLRALSDWVTLLLF